MDETQFSELASWITEVGLAGRAETLMLTGFCERAVVAGLPLASGLVIIDTLHPTHEGHAFRWREDEAETKFIEYGSSHEGKAAETWRRSPFYRLLETGDSVLRRRWNPAALAEFPSIKDMVPPGSTEYVAMISRFAAAGAIGEMDCVYLAWTTRRPGGFDDEAMAALRRLVPFLAIAMKCAALARVATNLVETYLGRGAGRLVLSGRIARGVADRIEAVLWFSDLRGYTKISDSSPPEEIVPLLNDYAEAVISAIHAEGGDVLKLIGDGVLAIFRVEDRKAACRSAIAAALAADRAIEELNQRRAGRNAPTTHMYLGLHRGEVYFGNIGSKDRLDFTVVGPAVNEVSRIGAMCRSLDQPVLTSAGFAEALGDARPRLVSVGRYALRGVGRAQELFTIDPEDRR
ncbi:MAG: adenylate/guanylate cyclase domain-containing protein [Proteobacteria bacterium]|nr:adenylate/guanylate cyclase domain-containing protein [Pseudomonadota bacterium]MBI3499017.1 adenylate/guanylate cyclase domain-containing protein [Pseudomonadota bacterium]